MQIKCQSQYGHNHRNSWHINCNLMILQIRAFRNMAKLHWRFQRGVCRSESKLFWIWNHRTNPRNLLQTDFWIRSSLWSTSVIAILIIKNGWKYMYDHLCSKQGRKSKIGLQQKFCIIISLSNIFIIGSNSKYPTLKTPMKAYNFAKIWTTYIGRQKHIHDSHRRMESRFGKLKSRRYQSKKELLKLDKLSIFNVSVSDTHLISDY